MSAEMETLLKGQIGSVLLAITKAQRASLDFKDIEAIAVLQLVHDEVTYLERYLFPSKVDEIRF